jgi:hypothetical protein
VAQQGRGATRAWRNKGVAQQGRGATRAWRNKGMAQQGGGGRSDMTQESWEGTRRRKRSLAMRHAACAAARSESKKVKSTSTKLTSSPLIILPKVVYLLSRFGRDPKHTKNCEPAESGLAERAMESTPANASAHTSLCKLSMTVIRARKTPRIWYTAHVSVRAGGRIQSFIDLHLTTSVFARQRYDIWL